MNVPTIEMDPTEARRKLKAYRAELHRKADAEYEAAAKGYELLGRGFRLIDIEAAIRAGGRFDDGLPKLAVARADRRVANCQLRMQAMEFYCGSDWGKRYPTLQMNLSIPSPPGFTSWRRYTRIPMVPADVKQSLREQKLSVDMGRYWILWEVERWYEHNPIEPPIDPYLLLPCGGLLFAVVAEWDLTELERSVMRSTGGQA